MKQAARHNFHVPLTTPVYQRLRTLAQNRCVPATQLVAQALEDWLERQEKLALHEEIARYAAGQAGTDEDLDPQLEAAGIESMDGDNP